MKVRSLPPFQLPADLRTRWVELQQANPQLSSPYFRPEFTEAVGRARADTFVAVIDDGEAFLPFHREALNFGVGRPVGSLLSDYHGVIAPANYTIDPIRLVRGMDLAAWEFNHLPASQTSFLPWAKVNSESPQVELSEWRQAPPKLSEENRKRRKLEREIGPLELEFDCGERDVFWQCMAWKADQYARTGKWDIMTISWVPPFLTEILAFKSREFGGILSVLRAGGRVVATHFGMRSGNVLHSWFPSYDITLASYSPGMILLMSILDAAGERGIDVVDLGRGDFFYKSRVATTAVPLIEGGVAANPWAMELRRSRRAFTEWVRKTPLRGPAQAFIDRLRR